MMVRTHLLFKRLHGYTLFVENRKVCRRARIVGAAIAALSLLSVTAVTAQAITIVSPNGLESTEGNSFGGAPTSYTRVQYLYPSSDFSSVLEHQLVGIAWRPDDTTGPTSTSTSSFTLRLSTTSVTELSTTFADNFGTDETLVFDGPITISTTADQTPRAFDFAVEIDTPFQYDPNRGNLLVEFTTSGFDFGGWRVDNQNSSSGPTLVSSGNPSNTVASNTYNTLAVMQFTFALQPPTLVGDYNGDGTVDAADYVVWRKIDGAPSGYDIWRANFGQTLSPGSGSAGYPLGASAEPLSAAAPEPATVPMLLMALILIRRRLRAMSS